jgi:hypothetical protein
VPGVSLSTDCDRHSQTAFRKPLEELAMKNTLLVSVAAAALLAGINAASAQMDRPAAGGSQPAEMNKGGAADQKGKAGADVKSEKPATNAQAPGGNARAQDNMKADTKGQAADTKGDNKGQAADTKGQAGDKMKADTKGQAQKQDDKGQAQKQDDKAQNAQSKPDSNKGGAAADNDKSKSSNTAQSGGAKNLNPEQKTKIRETVIKSGPRVTNVNFSISVGTVVPRTVKFAPLPTVLVEVYPEWSGYEYFIVGEEIIIVEPKTYKIVTVLRV